MATVEESIEVQAPIRAVYDQWTQFETFPEFMEHIERVVQTDDTHLQWKAKILGRTEEWTAEVTEQHPDERVAWASTSGAKHAGVATFHRVDDTTSRAIRKIMRADLICIDDIGLLPVTTETAEALYRVVDAAYEKRSIAISSNIHPSGFDELMPKTMATATVDRLLHHAHVIITDGQESYRLAQATAGKGVKPLI
jgi:hypothetical protein